MATKNAASAWNSPLLAGFVGGLCLAGAAPSTASAYDIDCKLILCMAGSFPDGCGDAMAYMIKRITAVPPKPPVGFCPMATASGGAEDPEAGYDAYDLDYRFLGAEPEAWACPPGKQISYIAGELRGRMVYAGARCFDEAREVCTDGRSASCRMVYSGEVPAIRYDMKFEITVEPGTPDAFSSGVQYLDFR